MVAVAQQVEHWIVIPEVAGSRPVGHPTIFPVVNFSPTGLGKPGSQTRTELAIDIFSTGHWVGIRTTDATGSICTEAAFTFGA
jgi:hypothetical protein